MMVICYFEKKTFVYIHLIFTLCANLQYISDHLKSNSLASPSLTLGIPQCRSRGLRPQGRRDQLHPLWRGPLLNMTWAIEYPCGCSWKPSPCLSSSVIASSPAPAIRPTRRGDLPSLSGTLTRPLLSLHTHWIPATKAHHIPGHWRLVTLTFLVTWGCSLVQHSPAPVILVPPGGASLDQLLHDLSVGASGCQVKWWLVWGPSSGAHHENFAKVWWDYLEQGLAPPPSRARARSGRPRDTARWSGVREWTSRSSRGKSSCMARITKNVLDWFYLDFTSINFSSFSKLLSRTAWWTAPTPAEQISSSSSSNAASLKIFVHFLKFKWRFLF